MMEKHQPIRVCLRLRPPSADELRSGAAQVVQCNEAQHSVTLAAGHGNQRASTFQFDAVWGSNARQEAVYADAVADLVCQAVQGYSCTVMCYGQTGSGKTHTMLGVIQLALADIHRRAAAANGSVTCSYLELYNEEMSDLLSNDSAVKVAMLDDGKNGPAVLKGLSVHSVNYCDQAVALLERAADRRQTASTLLNSSSSRSHAVFIVTIQTSELNSAGQVVQRHGKLHMVDLAGSESAGRSGAEGQQASEAGNINRSLSTLGRVIMALTSRQAHIPYRDSKLTRLLRHSLGGTSQTCIIATAAPTVQCWEETASTLRYAQQARGISNRPQVHATTQAASSQEDQQMQQKMEQLSAVTLELELQRVRAEAAHAAAQRAEQRALEYEEQLGQERQQAARWQQEAERWRHEHDELVKQLDQQQQQQAATALEDSVAVQLQQAANNEAEMEGLKAQLRRRDATIKRLQGENRAFEKRLHEVEGQVEHVQRQQQAAQENEQPNPKRARAVQLLGNTRR